MDVGFPLYQPMHLVGFRWSPAKSGFQSRRNGCIFVAIPCAGKRGNELFFKQLFVYYFLSSDFKLSKNEQRGDCF